MKIRLEEVKPSPRPIRSYWDEESLDGLARSIQKEGLIVPIKVRPLEGGGYEIVDGHRRVEACRRAGLDEVEAVVEGLDNDTSYVQAVVVNEVREALSLMDRARTYQRLHDELGLEWEQIAVSLGKSPRRIEEVVALLDEPEELTRYLEMPPARRGERAPDRLGAWQVQEITRALRDDDATKTAVARKAVGEGLTGEQTKEVARTIAGIKDPNIRQQALERKYYPDWRRTFIALEEIKAVQEAERRSPVHWELYPGAKELIELLRHFNARLDEAIESVEIGKLSPEAQRFVAHWLGRAEDKIAQFKRRVEQ